jgi:hypothetical protein
MRACRYTLLQFKHEPPAKEDPFMPVRLLHRLIATRPAAAPLAVGTLADLARSKPALLAENALLRKQLAILRRSVTCPRCTPADRALLVLLASRVRAWRAALLIVQ